MIQIKFSHNYTMENIENLESVKRIAKTNFKNLFDNKYSKLSHKEFYKYFKNLMNSSFASWKINIKTFRTFHKLNYGKTRISIAMLVQKDERVII